METDAGAAAAQNGAEKIKTSGMDMMDPTLPQSLSASQGNPSASSTSGDPQGHSQEGQAGESVAGASDSSSPQQDAADAARDTAITSHYADVNGVRIHYEKTGSGSHTLVLLPGALGSTRITFGPQLEKLDKAKYTIYALDPRGCGGSIPPPRDWPPHFLQRDAEDAVTLMKTLDLGSASVLGFCNGGTTALIVAGRHPDMVRRLVVWGSSAYITPKDLEPWRNIQDIGRWKEAVRKPFIEFYGRDVFQGLWTQWINAYERYLEERKGKICITETQNVRCPTLIIHGQKDTLVAQEHPDYLHSTIPGSTLVTWPEARHDLHMNYPDEFIKVVENFLDQDD